jgi:hypothetical protein
MNVRVYQYGLRPPKQNSEIVWQQLRLANRYYNNAIELLRARRAALRAAERDDTVEAIEQEIESRQHELYETRQQIKKHKQKSELVPSGLKARTKTLRSEVKPLRKKLTAARKEVRARLKVERAAIHERWLELRRSIRREDKSGVRHGTYTIIDDATTYADKSTPLYDYGTKPLDPRFKKFRWEGSIGVQIQGGVSVGDCVIQANGDDISDGHNSVQVRTKPYVVKPGRMKDIPRGKRAMNTTFATLFLRVGSEGVGNKIPVWAAFEMRMHRPLPPDGLIKRVNVSVRNEGPRKVWTAEFTVVEPEREPTCGTGAVAIDVGWREVENGLRVCAWYDEAGESGTLAINDSMTSALSKANELRSQRDLLLEEMYPKLLAWRDAHMASAPAWWNEKTKTMHLWGKRKKGGRGLKAKRFVALAREWACQRWDGDADGYELIETWRYADHHLWSWECGQRKQSIRRRRDYYRVFASQIAKKYEVVVLEKFDKRRVSMKAKPEVEDDSSKRARANRVLAAVSELTNSLRSAMRVRCGKVVEVPAAYSSRECPYDDCRYVCDADSALELTCPKCGRVRDRDIGAAKVLLRRWRERPGDDENTEGARKGGNGKKNGEKDETRWARVRRMRKEKAELVAAARKYDGMGAE